MLNHPFMRRARRRLRAMAAALCVATFGVATLGAGPALAHPHMFFDATAQFLLDESGAVTAIRIAFVVDELNSLYTVSELSMDQDGDGALTPEEEGDLARSVARGLVDFGYYTDLRDGETRVAVGPPTSGAAILDQGQIVATYDLPLPEPLATDHPLSLRLYDPTFFTAVTILKQPEVVGGDAQGCSVAFKKFDPDTAAKEELSKLASLSREETPDSANIGALFADEAVLTCDK